MEFSFDRGETLPRVDIADIIAKPMWLMTFQEEMLYFSREAIIDAKPDITAEKLRRFDESASQLAGGLGEYYLQAPIINTLHSLQHVYTDKYRAGKRDMQAADAINDRVATFVLTQTPRFAWIAFDEHHPLHTTALDVIAHAAGQYGHATLIPPFLRHHIGLYDRLRRTQQRAPQLYARNLLLHTPTQYQAIAATTLDALRQEGHDMTHEASTIGDSAPFMAHAVHPDVSRLVARINHLPEVYDDLVHSFLTTAQCLGQQASPASLKPFAQFASELQHNGPERASHFWLAT